jgi:predicted nucleic acid-binding protein
MEIAYVVDTTVLVSWLLTPSQLTGKIVRSLELQLFTPYKAVDELLRHRNEWSARRTTTDFVEFLDALRYYVNVIHVDPMWKECKRAIEVMGPIDPNDSEFLSLALRLGIPIWSHDAHFRQQSLAKVVSSSEILGKSHEIPTLWMALNE